MTTDIKIDLSTVNDVMIGGVWHRVEPGTFTLGRPQFFVPGAGLDGDGAWVSGSGWHPMSYFFTDTAGVLCTGPHEQIQQIRHHTPPPCTKDFRRPECSEGHIGDCEFTEPEPKHELLPIGTRVLVSSWSTDDDGRTKIHGHPVAGRISGYDTHRTKYQVQDEYGHGKYASYQRWVFVNNSVQVHPDGPECPPAPEPVKSEPTGPRVYVRHPRGKDGHVVEFGRKGEDKIAALVQWYVPGVEPVWVSMDRLTVIHSDDVARCENGQTGDECGSGENQCELCLAAEDEEADAIAESMGL